MKEQLITFDTAKLAKEKGFEQNEFYKVFWEGVQEKFPFSKALYYKDLIEKDKLDQETYTQLKIYAAPTQSLLQKWLFENHTIWVSSTPDFNANEMMGITVSISSWKFPFINVDYTGYDVYEGLEKGLQEALKLI